MNDWLEKFKQMERPEQAIRAVVIGGTALLLLMAIVDVVSGKRDRAVAVAPQTSAPSETAAAEPEAAEEPSLEVAQEDAVEEEAEVTEPEMAEADAVEEDAVEMAEEAAEPEVAEAEAVEEDAVEMAEEATEDAAEPEIAEAEAVEEDAVEMAEEATEEAAEPEIAEAEAVEEDAVEMAGDATEEAAEPEIAEAEAAEEDAVEMAEEATEDSGISALLASADIDNGQRVWRQCGACHVYDAEQNRGGPHLVNIIGREIGSAEGWRYSRAMSEHGGVWDVEGLLAWLENPDSYIPGNQMAFRGLRNEQDRIDVLGFLESHRTD